MKDKSIHNLKLHETTSHFEEESHHTWYITRVPSGWLYRSILGGSPVFVPYNHRLNLNYKR